MHDSSPNYVGFLHRWVKKPKVIVIVPERAWDGFERSVLQAVRPFAESTAVAYLGARRASTRTGNCNGPVPFPDADRASPRADWHDGSNLAFKEFGVSKSDLPTAVVLWTHYEDGSPRVGGPRASPLHAWRRRKAKRLAEGDKSPTKKAKALADTDPSPRRFRKQLTAFLRKYLSKLEEPDHPPLAAGKPITDELPAAHDEL